MESNVHQALNRIADAIFQRAAIEKKQLRLQEEHLDIQKALLELQMRNLAVTAHLEAALAEQAARNDGV